MNEHWIEVPVKRGLGAVEPILEKIQGVGYIGGSYAAFMATSNETPILPNDVDIFATSNEQAKVIARSLLGKGNRLFGLDENEVAYTVHHGCGDMNVQVVKPHPEWKTFPDDILLSFDMDICRALVTSPTTALIDENAGWLNGKILRTSNALRSLKRVLKYHQRGVEFNDHELLKLFQAWELMSSERKTTILEEARSEAFPVYSDSGDWDYDEDRWFEGE